MDFPWWHGAVSNCSCDRRRWCGMNLITLSLFQFLFVFVLSFLLLTLFSYLFTYEWKMKKKSKQKVAFRFRLQNADPPWYTIYWFPLFSRCLFHFNYMSYGIYQSLRSVWCKRLGIERINPRTGEHTDSVPDSLVVGWRTCYCWSYSAAYQVLYLYV